MKEIKLSIIIATYNSSETLLFSLESVKKLNFIEWECIVVDGASKDGTQEIIKSYADKDDRFKYITEPDKGIYDALNKGVKIASGEWIYVLGSDDTVTQDGLLKLLEAGENYDVVYGNVYIKAPNGTISKFFAKDYHKLKYVMAFSHQAVIVRRQVILNENSFNLNYRIRADFDLMQRIYLAGYKFKQTEAFIANYSANGFSSNAEIKTHIERYHVCKNNRSTMFPFMWFCYQEARWFVGNKILKNR